jgi:hypothetical protein
MRHCIAIIVMAFSFGLKGGSAQNPFEPDTHVACVERLPMPEYSALARQVKAEGTITASIVLSPRASVQEINTEFKSKTQRLVGLLIPLVEKAVTEAAFRSTCAGETVVLIFDFKVAGPPSDCPRQSVALGHPNKFWIVTEPAKLKVESSQAK